MGFNKFPKIFLWNLSLITISIVGFELTTGTWFFGNVKPPNGPSSRELIYDRSIINPNYGKARITYNSNYTRTIDPPHKIFSNKVCTILLMGGSTTEQRILKKEETWGSNLWKDLNSDDRVKGKCPGGIKIINAGMSGHSILGNIYDLKYWLKRSIENVDILILYQGINDNHEGFYKYTKTQSIAKNFKDQYYSIIYHSSIYKIFKGIRDYSKRNPNLKAENNIFKIKSNPGLKENVSTNKVKLNKSSLEEIYNTTVAKNYRDNITSFISLTRKIFGSKILVITQTFPQCDLRKDDEIYYISNKIWPDIKSVNSKKFQLRNISPKEYHNTSFGNCLRMRLNRDNFKIALRSLNDSTRSQVKLIDYASSKRASLDSMEHYSYHKTPRTSNILYQDFKKLGILKNIYEFLPD